MALKNFVPVQYESITLKGGLDLVTPTLSLQPGVVRDGLNFEVSVNGGYSRIAGYERFSGKAQPSAAVYSLFEVTYSGVPVLDAVVTGSISGATAVLIGHNATQIVITKIVGAFVVGDVLTQVGPLGTVTAIVGQAALPAQSAIYTALAAEYYRQQISAPTGAGACRGVVGHKGVVYAFRNNISATAVDVFKNSAAGWTQVAMYYEVAFTVGGAAEPVEGATLTQGSVTATIKRVVRESGTWGTSTAAGRLILAAPAGGSFTAAAATIGAIGLTLSGAESQISLLPNGHFEFVTANYGGTSGETRVYGCDGVNHAFEFDGDILVPIHTGMTTDAPKHIASFKNHLFLAFVASAQFSAIGDPYAWSVILGAGEISAEEEITNFLTLPGSQQGGALLIQTRNNTQILYGSSSADFNLVNFNVGVGALHYTAQNLAGAYYLDDRGIGSLNSTLNYGNFDQASLTANIRPFIIDHRTRAQSAGVNREKSQYRIFFNDGYGLYATIVNDKYLGCLPVYFPDPVFCSWEGEDSSGNEVTYIGGHSGMVYQLDRGTSFDGEAINAYITLNYNSLRSPRLLKRYRKASAEITGNSFAQIQVSYLLGYGSPELAPQASAAYASNFSTGTWDSGLSWDSGLVWDGRTLMPSEIELCGTGENISMTFSNNSNYTGEFTINSLILHYSLRRGIR